MKVKLSTDSLLHLVPPSPSSVLLVCTAVSSCLSPSSQEMEGAGLLCLVTHLTISTLLSVTVSSPPSVMVRLPVSSSISAGGTKHNLYTASPPLTALHAPSLTSD